MEETIDFDKKQLKYFINDLIDLYEGDRNKVYEQINEYLEDLEVQDILTNRV